MLKDACFWFFLCAIMACIEIESEGKDGWAAGMPTWRRTVRWSSRPITGYHSVMFLLPIVFMHIPFFMGLPWTLDAELRTLSMYSVLIVLWDFLWFVLNPHFGMSDFTKEKIWWHAKVPWVFGLFPADYLYGIIISCILAFIGDRLLEHLLLLTILSSLTVLTHIVLAPVYHRWYWKMRE